MTFYLCSAHTWLATKSETTLAKVTGWGERSEGERGVRDNESGSDTERGGEVGDGIGRLEVLERERETEKEG